MWVVQLMFSPPDHIEICWVAMSLSPRPFVIYTRAFFFDNQCFYQTLKCSFVQDLFPCLLTNCHHLVIAIGGIPGSGKFLVCCLLICPVSNARQEKLPSLSSLLMLWMREIHVNLWAVPPSPYSFPWMGITSHEHSYPPCQIQKQPMLEEAPSSLLMVRDS